MNDLQLLFLILVALYIWECAGWLRRGSMAFVTWLGCGWRGVHPGALVGNFNGGFFLASPLPPLGALFVATQFPVSLAPEGLLAFVATNINPGWRPAQSGGFIRWDQVGSLQVRGKKLFVDGALWLTVATPGLASYLLREFQQLAHRSPAQRGAAIAGVVRGKLDGGAIASRLREYRIQVLAMRRWSNGLFVYLFAIVPGLIWHFGLIRTWLGLLLGLLALTLTIATQFYRAHRALFPAAGDERFTHTLTIALAPSSALRAHDTLSRPLLEQFHPLAVAKQLLPDPEFRVLARRVLLDLRHPAAPRAPSGRPEVAAAEVYSRAAWREAIEEFLARNGLAPEKVARAPTPADDSCRSYCPRCDAQFTTVAGACADCGGLAVVELPRETRD